MIRPAHIHCEACVFWERQYPEADDGDCYLKPQSESKCGASFCGEWRDAWPGQVYGKNPLQPGLEELARLNIMYETILGRMATANRVDPTPEKDPC